MGGMELWIMIIAMFALMYFLMIRPENKRKKEAQNMRDSLKVGDEITTIWPWGMRSPPSAASPAPSVP